MLPVHCHGMNEFGIPSQTGLVAGDHILHAAKIHAIAHGRVRPGGIVGVGTVPWDTRIARGGWELHEKIAVGRLRHQHDGQCIEELELIGIV